MHPVTHLLAGWVVADECKLKGRDRALVAWSCVVPDLDGIGYVIDFINKTFNGHETTFYEYIITIGDMDFLLPSWSPLL